MTDPALMAIIIILAVLLDLGVMFWLRHVQESRVQARQSSVRVFGVVSPVLSWVRGKGLRVLRVSGSESTQGVRDQETGGTESAIHIDSASQAIQAESASQSESTIHSDSASQAIQAEAASQAESAIQAEAATQMDAATQPKAVTRTWTRWVEWAVIVVGVTLFCWGILDLRSLTNLPGNEAEVFQALDWTLLNSLRQYHSFPLWNQYIMSGIPYVGDPMLHVYNPLVTLPVLLLGVRAGFKLALYLSFLAGAFGMWRLGGILGMKPAARVWMALTFAFAGQPTARFFQGQYLFVLGFAWIPWVVGSLFQVVRLHRLKDVALAVICMALLFFSGNAYYPFYMLIMALLFGLLMLPQLMRRRPFIKLPWQPTWAYVLVGVLSLGVIAVQLLPTAEFWPRVNKAMKLEGTHSLAQIFLDYTSKDTYREDAYSVMPAREEFYAYIGMIPFLSLGLLPLAFWKRERKTLLYFVLILLFMLLWISVEYVPWREFFVRSSWLLQFRHLLRSLVIGSFALIVLAGYGLDTLWTAFADNLSAVRSGTKTAQAQTALAYAGLGLLALFMLLGVLDVFNTNQQFLSTNDVYTPAYRVMRWVRENDLGDYYVRHNPNNAWQDATISNNLRFLDAWYHFADIRSIEGVVNQRPVVAEPQYLTQSQDEPDPQTGGAVLKSVVEKYNIFELKDSLPLAFVVSNVELAKGSDAGQLQRRDVTPMLPHFSSTGHVDVIAEGHGGDLLVVMITNYPGWTARMDGEVVEIKNVGGYLAVDLPPGPHQFEFIYQPRSFFWGFFISLITTGITGWLLLRDLPLTRRRMQEALPRWQAGLKQGRERLQGWRQRLAPESVQAVYRQGALHPTQALDLAEETPVEVAVLKERAGVGELLRTWLWASARLLRSMSIAMPLASWLFVVAIAVYVITRLWRLADFPIYFFTDEAIQSLSAANLLHNQLRSPDHTLLPTYFQNGMYFNLSLSVYIQLIPTLLFGKSIFVTRAVSALVSLLAAGAVGLILRDIFKVRYWWLGTLLLSITPAWFLHSRTAFETVLFVSMYAVMFYAYLLYRYRDPRFLFLAIFMAGLAFYSYSPGQLIVVVTWILFLLSDLPYHWKNRRLALPAAGLVLLVALPYLRFRWESTFDPGSHLSILGSYWMQPLPLGEKLARFWQEYLKGISPAYWFFPNEHDLQRHLMKGYGHISRIWLPFGVLGALLALWKGRFSAYRNTLVILLAAPLASALVGIGITRVLVFVIPAVLLIALGLELALGWLEKLLVKIGKTWKPETVSNTLAVGLAIALCWANFAMLRDALVNGPTWFQDYGLGGMQYGAKELYAEVKDYLNENPEQRLLISPSWANGADAVTAFFLPTGLPVQMGSIDGYIFERQPLDDRLTFVMIPEELDKVMSSGKFKDVNILRTLYYPNRKPGFYFVQLGYVDDIDAILAAERELRKEMQMGEVTIQGQPVNVHYSPLDMGTIQHIFDGDLNTVARTMEANPFIIELTFPEARLVSGYVMTTGSASVKVTALLVTDAGAELLTYTDTFQGTISDPGFTVIFDQSVLVKALQFEILEVGVGEPAHVHVWEIEVR